MCRKIRSRTYTTATEEPHRTVLQGHCHLHCASWWLICQQHWRWCWWAWLLLLHLNLGWCLLLLSPPREDLVLSCFLVSINSCFKCTCALTEPRLCTSALTARKNKNVSTFLFWCLWLGVRPGYKICVQDIYWITGLRKKIWRLSKKAFSQVSKSVMVILTDTVIWSVSI